MMHGVSALFAGKPITWLTPLGLPVLQPYRSSGSYQVKTCLQVAPQPNHAIKPQPRIATHVSLTISPPPLLQHVILARDTDHLPVNSRKQSTAFAPNFIHSIDSTHLLMTASDCAARGLTFAGLRACACKCARVVHLLGLCNDACSNRSS